MNSHLTASPCFLVSGTEVKVHKPAMENGLYTEPTCGWCGGTLASAGDGTTCPDCEPVMERG